MNIFECRRQVITALFGVFPGLLFAKPAGALTTKSKIKHILGKIEAERWERSRPSRHPSFTWKSDKDTTCLFLKGAPDLRPLFTMNRVGRTIWEGCDGTNTPGEISKLIREKYLVSSRKADTDCLSFLAALKTKGAIRL